MIMLYKTQGTDNVIIRSSIYLYHSIRPCMHCISRLRDVKYVDPTKVTVNLTYMRHYCVTNEFWSN